MSSLYTDLTNNMYSGRRPLPLPLLKFDFSVSCLSFNNHYTYTKKMQEEKDLLMTAQYSKLVSSLHLRVNPPQCCKYTETSSGVKVCVGCITGYMRDPSQAPPSSVCVCTQQSIMAPRYRARDVTKNIFSPLVILIVLASWCPPLPTWYHMKHIHLIISSSLYFSPRFAHPCARTITTHETYSNIFS
jgi:hypothetical protein